MATLTFDQIMKKAPALLTSKFNKEVADAFAEYIEEEEIEQTEILVNDVKQSAAQSSIVEAICSNVGWGNDKQKAKQLHKGLRILFGLEKDQKVTNVILPTKVKWTNFSAEDCKAMHKYINAQCFNSFGSSQDKSFFEIEAIGRNHNLNLVPLLFDVYSFYKWKSPQNEKIIQSLFCSKSSVLKKIQFQDADHKHIYQSLIQTLGSFEYRFIPPFHPSNPCKIDDDINAYIEYTLIVSNMLNKVTSNNKECLPLLVDLWIIPKKAMDTMNSNGDDDDDEEEDDDDDDDDDSDDEEKELEDCLPNDFDANLKKYKAIFDKGSIDYASSAKASRILEQIFRKILAKARRSVKICIIIDRRKENGENLLVYLLPLKYSAIPSNYYHETLIYSSSHHLMFDIDGSIQGNNPIFGATTDCNGRMFCLSFALSQKDENRIQFWRGGGGIRFWPQYMTTIWPRLFFNAKVDKKYVEKGYFEEKFGLSVKDSTFEAWYKCIVDFDK